MLSIMSRAERLLQLMQVLRRHRAPASGAALAGELGVSLRTLYRDIASLQAQGATIEGEAGVGYLLRPGFTEEEVRKEAHVRAQHGTSCYRVGRCRLPNSYLYDKEIIPRVAQYIRMDGRFDDTAVWVQGERRLVTLMGCVRTKEQAEQMEKAVLLVDDVMGVVNYLSVGTGARPKYPVAP